MTVTAVLSSAEVEELVCLVAGSIFPKGCGRLKASVFHPPAMQSSEHKVPFHLPGKGIPPARDRTRRLAPGSWGELLGTQCPLKEVLRTGSEVWEALQGKLAGYSLKWLEIISGKSGACLKAFIN